MMFRQIKDIVNEINQVYDRLYEFYGSLLDETEGEKSRELIKYVKSRKKLFSEILNEYKKSGEKEVLATWLQFSPDYSLEQQIKNIENTSTNLNTLNLLVIRFEAWLLDFYRYIIDTTSSTKVSEFFESLHQRQQKNLKTISTSVKILQDI